MHTRYLPEYYVIDRSDYSKDISDNDYAECKEATRRYCEAVSLAVAEAKKQFIEPLQDKHIIYSRTWGK